MKKIVREDALQVTFSKRKTGIFNKASEIAILCGVHLLVVIFSPGGKLYMFGSPDANAIMQCFITGNPMQSPDPYTFNEILMPHLTGELTELSMIRDREKKYLSELKKSLKECGMDEDEELGVDELEVYINSLNKMRHKLVSYLEYLTNNPPTTSSLCPGLSFATEEFFAGNQMSHYTNAGNVNVGSTFMFP